MRPHTNATRDVSKGSLGRFFAASPYTCHLVLKALGLDVEPTSWTNVGRMQFATWQGLYSGRLRDIIGYACATVSKLRGS